MGLFGCSVNVDEYAKETPTLNAKEYFDGKMLAWGFFQNRSGKIVTRFKVDIDASWKGDELTLTEKFFYSSGKTQDRTWVLKLNKDNTFTATAGDVVGQAEGKISGNAMRMNYTLALDRNGKTINVQMDDWLILMDETYMINRATMSKFGVKVGEITLFFQKL